MESARNCCFSNSPPAAAVPAPEKAHAAQPSDHPRGASDVAGPRALIDSASLVQPAGRAADQQLTGFLVLVELQRGKHIATSATIGGVRVSPLAILLADGRDAVVRLLTGSPQNPIVGYVTNSAGQAAAGATITLFDGGTQAVASATTDVTGLYRITNTGGLTPGATYTAKVTTFPPLFTGTTPGAR